MENIMLKVPKKDYMNLETEKKILGALTNWEDQLAYLNPACSIASTAKDIGCNSKYLSFVVNKNKNLDFPNYINKLRLAYLDNYLKTTEEARNFKLTYLAAISGFSSYGKFAKSIKDHKGLNPTQYIVFFDSQIA